MVGSRHELVVVCAGGYHAAEGMVFCGAHIFAARSQHWLEAGLVGADIASALRGVVWTGVAALVGGEPMTVRSERDVVNGRAALLQGDGLGWSAVTS